MKIAFFNFIDVEEKPLKQWIENHKDIEVSVYPQDLTKDNMELISDVDAIVLSKNDELDEEVYHFVKKSNIKAVAVENIYDEVLKELIRRNDVLYTPHSAFFTDVSIKNSIDASLNSAVETVRTGKSKNQIII